MNKNTYVRNTVKKIKCGRSKKKEIKKQLEADIDIRLEQGEPLEKIIAETGSPKEFADNFNENLSDAEKRRYRRDKTGRILLPVFIILVILGGLLYWFLPKVTEIENSRYFDKTQVEDVMKETVALLDENDYTALKAMSNPQMSSFLTEEMIASAKKQLSDDFGKQISCGTPYVAEIVQYGNHLAVGEITVSYENVSVTYRLTYDKDMKLTGLYMR